MGNSHLNKTKFTLHADSEHQSDFLKWFDLAPNINERKHKAVCEKVQVDNASNNCHHHEDVDE